MVGLSTTVRHDGGAETRTPWRSLRAGPLTLALDGVDLRYIQLGDRELLRRVYVAVRDRNWGAVPVTLSDMRLEAADDSFTLTFDAAHRDGPIDYAWRGTITGGADGTITYTMDGEARSTFLKNRIGLCVLHPMACAGLPCTVRRADGTVKRARFPRHIAPHQPFDDFVTIAHDLPGGPRVEVRLDGDIFEMEDQRNWTDASFKTYGTPLRLPFPVEVPRGARIRQLFALSLHDVPAAPRTVTGDEDAIAFDISPRVARPLPRLGLGMASHGRPLDDRALDRLRALRLSHLRVDLDPGDPAYPDRLDMAAREARALGARLDVALLLSDDAPRELAALASAASSRGASSDIAAWIVFHKGETSTTERWVRLARTTLRDVAPGAAFGGGTNAYFAELNRGWPPLDTLDLVSYSINPQVHAFDNASLVETLAAQETTLESARRFCGDRPLVVGPVTLRPRFNPNATGPEPSPAPGRLPPQVDPRQMSLFGAVWTLGSLKYLTRGGAASVTYYETTGWRGVMASPEGSPLPDLFPSSPGMVFPLYHVLADADEFAGTVAVEGTSGDPLRVDGLALRIEGGSPKGVRTRILLGNMTAEFQRVRVGPLDAGIAWVRLLDEEGYDRAMRDAEAFRCEPGDLHRLADGVLRLTLPPYAVARIDVGSADAGA